MSERFKSAVCVDLLMIKNEDNKTKVLLMRRKNTGDNDDEFELAGGHLEENEDVFLIQPPYFTPQYTSGYHLSTNGYRWLGEYTGKAMFESLVQRTKQYPLLPSDFKIDGKKIYIKVKNATLPLEQTTSVAGTPSFQS